MAKKRNFTKSSQLRHLHKTSQYIPAADLSSESILYVYGS